MGKIKFFNPVVFEKGSAPSIDDFASTKVTDYSYNSHPYHGGDQYISIREPDASHSPGSWLHVGNGWILYFNPYAWTPGVGKTGTTGNYPRIKATNDSPATLLVYTWGETSSGYVVLTPGKSTSWISAGYGNNMVTCKVWAALKTGGIFSLKNIKKWRVVYEAYHV